MGQIDRAVPFVDDWGKWHLAVAERRDDNSPAFQCRVGREINTSPGGTKEVCGMKWRNMVGTLWRPFCRPCGTRAGANDDPALKRRAIVGLSRWDERGRTGRSRKQDEQD